MSSPCVALYVRISEDPLHLRAGAERQLEDGHRIAAARWPGVPVKVYEDNDLSAWSGKKRPAFLDMLAAIKSGAALAVVAYNLDRLLRLPIELEGVIAVCNATKFANLVTAEGDLDLTSSDGQFVARVLVAQAKKSSDDTSRRVRRSLDKRRAMGLPVGRPTSLRTNLDQLAAMEWAAAEIVSGRGLLSIWRAMPNQFPGARHYASIVGLRKAVMHDDLLMLSSDREVIETARAIIRDPRRRRPDNGGEQTRKWWLSGLLRCGSCGKRMNHSSMNGGSYRCNRNDGGCGNVSVNDRHIEAYVFALVRDVAASEHVVTDDPAPSGERLALEARSASILADRAEGLITRDEWIVARDIIAAKIAALTPRTVVIAPLPALADRWATMTADERFATAANYLDSLNISPAARRGKTFDSGRVDPRWRN